MMKNIRKIICIAIAGTCMLPAAVLASTGQEVQNAPQDIRAVPLVNVIEITGNHLYKAEELANLITIRPGMQVTKKQIETDMASINTKYSQDGYLFSKVIDGTLDKSGTLHFNIHEGRVEDIQVVGNTKTKTNVVLREVVLQKGLPFNSNLARRSVQRLYNTGYFGDVNIELMPGQFDKNDVIVVVDVEEQKTGLLTLAGGYSNSNRLVGIIGLSDLNFRGRGDQVSINYEFGGETGAHNYTFSYTHPWVNSHGDSISFSIFDHNYDYDDYNQEGNSVAEYYKRTKGGNITFGRASSSYVRDYLTLETKHTDYDEFKGGYDYRQVPGYLDDNFGHTNTLSWAHVYDNRDNVFDPTRGKRLSLTGVMAGHGLGGDFSFYKLITEGRWYHKMGRANVLALRLMGGIGFGGNIPYSDLFTLGGADTLRGYEDDEFRGNRFYGGTIEYRIPIMKKVQGVLFIDGGNAWGGTDNLFWYEGNGKFHYSGGAGLRITTPIGSVRLDYGRGNDGGKFHFSFGGKF